MMQKKNQKMMLSAALGSLLGSLSAVFLPQQKSLLGKMKNQTGEWTQKAKELTGTIFNMEHKAKTHSEGALNNFVAGACLGLLLGAGSAIFLTPKTGKQLRHDVKQKYQNASEKTQDLIDYMSLNLNGSKKNQIKSEPKRAVPAMKKKLIAKAAKVVKTAKVAKTAKTT